MKKRYSIDDVMRLAPDRFQARVRKLDQERQRRQRNQAPFVAKRAKRRAAQLKRTVPWADAKAISLIYAEASAISRRTGIVHHVDHIYPLQGERVSGLHVAENLQILPATSNLKKGNRL